MEGDWRQLAEDFAAMMASLVTPIEKQHADHAEAIMRLYIATYHDTLSDRLDKILEYKPKSERA